MLKHKTGIFPPQFSETVLAELDTRFSRKTADVAASEGPLPFGLVLARGQDGVYQPLAATQAAAEGGASGGACAILLSSLEASETRRKALILTGYAIINASRLVWDASVTDKTAALAQLEACGLIVKEVADGFAE